MSSYPEGPTRFGVPTKGVRNPIPLDSRHNERHNMAFPLRVPCRNCKSAQGYVRPSNGQNCVFCLNCQEFQYNAPKTETGQKQRSVSTVHEGIAPSKRARIIERATARCEFCGTAGNLHIGHILSVDAGFSLGLTDIELNADENLACMCEECNLGFGKLPLSPRLYVALLRKRLA